MPRFASAFAVVLTLALAPTAQAATRVPGALVQVVANGRGQVVILTAGPHGGLSARRMAPDGRLERPVRLPLSDYGDPIGYPTQAVLTDSGLLAVANAADDRRRVVEGDYSDDGCCVRLRLVTLEPGHRPRRRFLSGKGNANIAFRLVAAPDRVIAAWDFEPDRGQLDDDRVQFLDGEVRGTVPGNKRLRDVDVFGGRAVLTVARADDDVPSRVTQRVLQSGRLGPERRLTASNGRPLSIQRVEVAPDGRQVALVATGRGLRLAAGRVGERFRTTPKVSGFVYGTDVEDATLRISRSGEAVLGVGPDDRRRALVARLPANGRLARRAAPPSLRVSEAPRTAFGASGSVWTAFTRGLERRGTVAALGRIGRTGAISPTRVLADERSRKRSCRLVDLTPAGAGAAIATWACARRGANLLDRPPSEVDHFERVALP